MVISNNSSNTFFKTCDKLKWIEKCCTLTTRWPQDYEYAILNFWTIINHLQISICRIKIITEISNHSYLIVKWHFDNYRLFFFFLKTWCFWKWNFGIKYLKSLLQGYSSWRKKLSLLVSAWHVEYFKYLNI